MFETTLTTAMVRERRTSGVWPDRLLGTVMRATARREPAKLAIVEGLNKLEHDAEAARVGRAVTGRAVDTTSNGEKHE